MTSEMPLSKDGCLIDEDLYLYISGQGSSEALNRMESHLTECVSCRRQLAETLEILHPKDENTREEIPPPSGEELDRTVALIREVARKERAAIPRPFHLFHWPLVAAASIAIIALTFWSLKYFYEIRNSAAFYSQAEAIMNQNYVDASPNNLRLDLPFHSSATNRSAANPESLRQAEFLFAQALAYRETMANAHLGLGAIYLRESKLDSARKQFQSVLDASKGNVQALVGRGVTQYEQAIQDADPLKRRPLLEGALRDFDEALKILPHSTEALYNKIWTLYESGLHKEALREIERYLSRDSTSMGAEELKALRVKMKATQSSAVYEDVRRFARERNKDAIMELARLAPYQMPAAIMDAMRQSFRYEQTPAAPGDPDSEDLLWAVDVMETAYRATTGDVGFKGLLAFHAGLSPPQRKLKRDLDEKVKNIDVLSRKGQFGDALKDSFPLISQYAKLQDFWQVADVHQIRGYSYYLGQADFNAAEAEARKMMAAADRLNSAALKAKALGLAAVSCSEQRKFDDALNYANQSKSLAQSHSLKSAELYACMLLGSQFRHLGQFERSFREYAAVLKAAYRLMDNRTIVDAFEDLGMVADRLGRIQDARDFYHEAVQQQDDFLKNGVVLPTPELSLRRCNLLFDQGELSLQCGDLASAELFFKKSLSSTPPGMDELEARNRLGLAEVYFRANRSPEAETMVASVNRLNASGRYSEIDWQTRSLEGRLQEREGHHERALILLGQATDMLETMRRSIHSKESGHSFFEDRFDPFKMMVSILSKSADNKKKTLEFADRAKSIALKESLILPNSVSRFQKDAIGIGHGISPYPTVEYFFTFDELLIFLTGKDQIEIFSQNIPKKEMILQVREYLESIQQKDQKNFHRMARRLYDELIAPLEGKVFENSPEILMILPDGPLHLLPFAGLQDRQSLFLIEKTPLAYAPSRSVLQSCMLSGQKKFREDFRTMLINGSAGLSSAQKELSRISEFFGGNATILASKDLSIFKKTASASAIVHFSGHAMDKQGQPVLLLRASPNEIYLDSQAIAAWNMPQAYLVNLAGCNTGTGPLSEGASPWGLIPSFLNAGAPAIIASLTAVDDGSTERLNCRFYELLRKGVGKAKALQKAQIELLHPAHSNPDIQPQSWVPYILIGNPQ
jgi:CHAT domain-containing protein